MLGGHVIFCDDIREELHGKSTYVGRYQNTIGLSVPLPTIMPKLGLVVVWSQTIDEQLLQVEWEMIVPWQEEPVLGGSFDFTQVKITDSPLRPEERVLTMETGVVLAPFEIKSTGDIRIVATRDGRKIHLRRIEVQAPAKIDAPESSGDEEAA
jgi:hypothetical protein